jgi:ComF family protein
MLLTRVIRQVVEFCYPGQCAVCESAGEHRGALCASCLDDLRRLERMAGCSRCGRPLTQADSPCPYCMGRGIFPFQRIVRLGTFSDPLKHLIHQTKYHRRWELSEELADRLLEQERAKGVLTETDCLVAVPLHPLRHIGRGYNQAEVLARRLGRRCDIRVVRPVVRLRNTATQTHLHSRAKRIENLRDAFGLVDGRCISGQHVVVVDDVMTSGATLQAVGRVLREARPASLCAMVLAVADPLGRGFQAV